MYKVLCVCNYDYEWLLDEGHEYQVVYDYQSTVGVLVWDTPFYLPKHLFFKNRKGLKLRGEKV